MKQEIFAHYNSRLKIKIVRTAKTTVKLLIMAKTELINYLTTANYYRSEIAVQCRVFKQNSRDINRFRKPTNYDN